MEHETQHELHHHEGHAHDKKKENLIPISIIIGAIIISASIFYNTKLVIKNFVSGEGSLQGTAQNQAQAPSAPGVQANPGQPAAVAERKDAPTEGKGRVTVVEFIDFQCPFCQNFFTDAYRQIKEKYINTGKVKFIYRHFPLPIHQNAQKAAEAAECANRQGKFMPYHDMLFTKGQADGTGLDVSSLKKYASGLKLNTSKFNQCLDNGETAEVVKKDEADGQAAGVSGTPTFYVNGKQIVGAQPFSVFEQPIEAELK